MENTDSSEPKKQNTGAQPESTPPDSSSQNLHIQFDRPEDMGDDESIALQKERELRKNVTMIEVALNKLNYAIKEAAEIQGEKIDPKGWRAVTWNAEEVGPDELIHYKDLGQTESLTQEEPNESGQIIFSPPIKEDPGSLTIHIGEREEVHISVSSMDKINFTNITLNPDSAKDVHLLNLEECANYAQRVASGGDHIRAFGQSGNKETTMKKPIVLESQVPKNLTKITAQVDK